MTPAGEALRSTGIRWSAKLLVAVMAAVLAYALWLLVRATDRGLDLTDEGIYLSIYRSWRHPELTFTGAPVILGPIFQWMGWSIPWLRVVKLAMVVGSAGFLGMATVRFIDRHTGIAELRAEKYAVSVLAAILGSFSVYAWLPQSPGYNDLAIVLSATMVGLVLLWSTGEGRRSNVYAACVGVFAVLLLLVKWPSAIMISAGITAFIVSSGRGRRFARFVGYAVLGGSAVVLLVQVAGGGFINRARVLTASTDTILKGAGFLDAYMLPYARNLGDTASVVARIAGPVLLPVLIVSMLLVKRRPLWGSTLYAAGLLVLIPWARYRGYLAGGEINVVHLESTFPLLFVGALGVAALVWVSQRGRAALGRDADLAADQPVVGQNLSGRSLTAGLVLLALAPLLQAIGTGNPMFRIAFCAGAAWTSAVCGLLIVSVERGGRIFLLPAVASVLGMCCVGLLPGVQGLWTDSFRVGPLWDETVSMPGVPELRGIRLDPTTAGLINDTREVLRREGFLGKPGFSTSNGTGLTYAVGMPGPLSGLFVEEPLPDVLRVRIREACRIGAIDPGHPPVVLSIGATRPEVATTELQSCGINFPGAYRAVRVPVVDGGFLFMRKDGITVWLPNG